MRGCRRARAHRKRCMHRTNCSSAWAAAPGARNSPISLFAWTMRLAECACFSKSGNAPVVVAQGPAKDFVGVLAQKRRRRWIDGWSEPHIERCLDIGDHAGGGMRDSTETMPLTRFRRVEPLLHGSQIADRNVGLFIFAIQFSSLSVAKTPAII